MNSTPDILIIGGGAIGLATAIELALQNVQVTVLTRDVQEAATQAAAGMLAPQAEQLAPGPMLELCLRSRSLYPEWIQKLEALSGLDAQYWPCSILTPLYEKEQSEQSTSPVLIEGSEPQWLSQSDIVQRQPGLSDEVMGGWWFPADAQVDNQALAQVLYAAAETVGVTLHTGVSVDSIEHRGDRICHINTSMGSWQAERYLLATGAWSGELLPIPVQPRKGQMVSVQAFHIGAQAQPLRHVLFGTEVYLIPRRNGRILIGATNEAVGFQSHNTPLGVQTLLAAAMRLLPQLSTMTLERYWSGFRPVTPDEEPILGTSRYQNLFLATGHYRNGILLAPVTAKMIAPLMLSDQVDPLLSSFSWQRFGQKRT